jgi:hypothetical protein
MYGLSPNKPAWSADVTLVTPIICGLRKTGRSGARSVMSSRSHYAGGTTAKFTVTETKRRGGRSSASIRPARHARYGFKRIRKGSSRPVRCTSTAAVDRSGCRLLFLATKRFSNCTLSSNLLTLSASQVEMSAQFYLAGPLPTTQNPCSAVQTILLYAGRHVEQRAIAGNTAGCTRACARFFPMLATAASLSRRSSAPRRTPSPSSAA